MGVNFADQKQKKRKEREGTYITSNPIPTFILEESIYDSVIVNQLPLDQPPN